jgi:phage-related protein
VLPDTAQSQVHPEPAEGRTIKMNIIINESVKDFVRNLEKPTISKFSKMVDLLNGFGSSLTMPCSRKISNQLFELRIRGQQEVRIFYTFHDNQVVLFHGFVKKTQNTPLREIETAQAKLKMLTKL